MGKSEWKRTGEHILANKDLSGYNNTQVETTNRAWCNCAALFFEMKLVILSCSLSLACNSHG
jgi:hypothetical protein